MGLLGLRPLGPQASWASGLLGLWAFGALGLWASGDFGPLGILGLWVFLSFGLWASRPLGLMLYLKVQLGLGPRCDNISSMGFLCVLGLLGISGLWASGPLVFSFPLVKKVSCNIRPLGLWASLASLKSVLI